MEGKKITLLKWIINIFFLFIALVSLFPVLGLLISSLLPSAELIRNGMSFNFDLGSLKFSNYLDLFTEGGQYWKWYGNSLITTTLTIVLSLLFCSMVGYALALYEFKGKTVVFMLVLFMIMVPFEILMLPTYKLMISTNLIDTYTAVILPLLVMPVTVYFFRQYAMGLPKELMESARIDGCTEYGIFFRIMMPLMLPSFAAMAIMQGLRSWNNFLWPLLVLRSGDMFTLPVGLATLIDPYSDNYNLLISGSVMTIIPIVLLFIFFQRYFVAGLTVGGVKG